MTYDLTGKRVWVAGHRGMVGGAICRRLLRENCDILTAGREVVDLCSQAGVRSWMDKNKPDAVFVAAAKVGGIHANNTKPAEFLYENLAIETNIIHAAHEVGVEKLLFLGSSCIYPREAPQPITEEALLTGPLEPTNEWYAIAKIAGLKLCQAYRRQYGDDFISAMPTNLYGPGDNYDLQGSHVLPAFIRKCHEAKIAGATEMEVWGTGKPRREFLYVDDLADALIFLMKNYSGEVAHNVGVGKDISILELAELVAKIVGWEGKFVQNTSKPDGMMRKLMDVNKLTELGWSAQTSLEEGIALSYDWFSQSLDSDKQVRL